MKRKYILTTTLALSLISSFTYADDREFIEAVCERVACDRAVDVYAFSGMSIRTVFYGPTEGDSKWQKDNNYSRNVHSCEVVVTKYDRTLWRYDTILEPHGGIVALSKATVSPKEQMLVFYVSGNHSNKLILVSQDGTIEEIPGTGRFTWEDDERYIFTTLSSETPEGFMIYDVLKRKVAFRTDKYILDWKMLDDGRYECKEQLWEKETETYGYHILTTYNGAMELSQHEK